MKKIFTLCIGLVAALAVQAQSDFPLQFIDESGNVIADGTTLDFTDYEEDSFGDVQMPTKMYVKNTSDQAVQGGGSYNIYVISSGKFQTCFPANCVRQTFLGEYTTENGEIAAGELKDMQTEWYPESEGTCVVVYQLITFKQNPITKKWTRDQDGPTVTLNFRYETSAIGSVSTGKSVSRVEYYNLSGCRVQKPVSGMYIIRTTYSDGSTTSSKHLY